MEENSTKFVWIDLLWLLFLGGLALMPPVREAHKQLILLTIGLFQIFDRRLLASVPPARRNVYSVLIKILLATLLIGHSTTGAEPAINTSYYLIYFLPVVSAGLLFEAPGALLWTAVSCIAYCSYLVPALLEFQLTPEGRGELCIRMIFFFLAAVVVNRFATENRRQALRYQKLAETLAETNRQLERAEADARRSERLAALGQLSAGLAHEIRNPLAVIKGSAETLEKKVAADVITAELAGYISAEVNRLNALVSRFLDFARPSRLELQRQQVIPLLQHTLKTARERWPEAKVQVESHYASDLPDVDVDAALCEQVFANLVQNAYEAMGADGGKLKIFVTSADRASDARGEKRGGVIIDFQDTGPGVPANLREQIFNPFFTTKSTGVGLGLSIVSKIIDDHHGWIYVANGAVQGACFRLFLPAAEQAARSAD